MPGLISCPQPPRTDRHVRRLQREEAASSEVTAAAWPVSDANPTPSLASVSHRTWATEALQLFGSPCHLKTDLDLNLPTRAHTDTLLPPSLPVLYSVCAFHFLHAQRPRHRLSLEPSSHPWPCLPRAGSGCCKPPAEWVPHPEVSDVSLCSVSPFSEEHH